MLAKVIRKAERPLGLSAEAVWKFALASAINWANS
jgi:hypothetical protein